MNATNIKAFSILVATAVQLAASPGWTGESGDRLAALEKKLHGDWVGLGPCDGEITFHPEGTYERRHVGPGGDNSAGDWDVLWDALPPTLVLCCTTADDPTEAGKTLKVKILELDKGLVVDYGSDQKTLYERPSIDEARAIEIAAAHIAAKEKWPDRAVYEAKRVDKGWSIVVWREPKAPGGHRVITLTRGGRLIDYMHGR